MVHYLNHCKCISTASGSEHVDLCCHKRFNNNKCYIDPCELITDRNYAILKKICNKIFKEYNRSKCREKYAIFDGGTNINVRIHRSASNDKKDVNAHGDHCDEKSFREKHTFGQRVDKSERPRNYDPDVDDKSTRNCGNKKKRKGDDKECDTMVACEKKFEKFTERDEKNEDYRKANINQINKNKMDYISHIKPEERYKAKMLKPNQNQTKRFHEQYENKKDRPTKLHTIASEKAKIKNGKRENKHKANTDYDYSRSDVNGEIGKLENGKGEENRKARSNKIRTISNYRIISDLRDKVRKGEIIGFDNESNLNKTRKPRTLTYTNVEYFPRRKNKPSRADEAKACDYLRAQMEQRELSKLCCCPQSGFYKVNPKSCSSRCCPNNFISCVPQICKC